MESEVTGNCHASFGERDEETRQLRGWKVRFVPTPFSPLLANVALHGLEEWVKSLAPFFQMKEKSGRNVSITNKRQSISLIRYADDFVCLHENIEVIHLVKKEIEKWLFDIGLKLKPNKTRITHTLENYGEEKAGFNFLGFNIRQHKTGKYTSGKHNGNPLGFKTIIIPSKEKQIIHYRRLKDIINNCKGVSQAVLIQQLNPVIRGWCHYYSSVCSKKIFSKLTYLLKYKLMKWGYLRHTKKGRKWVINKYFQSIGGDNWAFATRAENSLKLYKHHETEIKRFVKVKGDASPYDGNLTYWSSRLGKHPEMPIIETKLLKMQKGRCNYCGNLFQDGDLWEKDHIIPKSLGGKKAYNNLQLLHRHCHDKKTATDGSLGNKSGCNSTKPKSLSYFDWSDKVLGNLNYQWIDDMLVVM